MPRVLILSVLVLLSVGYRAHAATPTRIPCWQAKLWLEWHGNDGDKARQAAMARGYTRDEIADAEKRCK